MPAAADSWYHEKESAWLYGAVAAAGQQPACWRRADPAIADQYQYRPNAHARVVALRSQGNDAIYAAAGITACALFGLGVALSLFTGHGALRGGLRQTLIGGGAGLAAWSIGSLLGASVG